MLKDYKILEVIGELDIENLYQLEDRELKLILAQEEVKKDKQPVNVRKQVTYVTPHSSQNSYQILRKNKHVLYDTIPQRAFKSQTPSIRYNIQGELMKMGYYYGNLDGYWGLKTEHAVSSYARDTKQLHLLTSIRGANSLFNEIINITISAQMTIVHQHVHTFVYISPLLNIA